MDVRVGDILVKGKAAAKRADQIRRENDGIKDLRRMKRCLNS